MHEAIKPERACCWGSLEPISTPTPPFVSPSPQVGTLWVGVLPFHTQLRLVDVLLYHGMHGYLVGCLALARASAALVGSHATAQDAVVAIRNAWRQPGVGPPLMCR